MAYRPRHQPQLGRGVAVPGRSRGSRDCGPRTWQMGIDYVTGGRKRPGVFELRKRAEKVGPKTTNIWDAERAVESYRNIPGRRALKYWIKRDVDDVRLAVRRGRFVHVCVHYGVWNRLNKRTGDPRFTGGHSMGVLGERRDKRGVVQWLLFDPLEDSRRTAIAQGPRWVRRRNVIRAMEAFAGARGRCYAGVFGGGERE